MKKKDKPKAITVQWYLDFANMDFNTCAKEHFTKYQLLSDETNDTDMNIEFTRHFFIKIQTKLRNLIEELILGSTLLNMKVLNVAYGVHLDEYTFGYKIMTDDPENLFLINFLDALAGFESNHLRKCPECGNFFLHISKKDRKFCTNNCAARTISRERRYIEKLQAVSQV